MRVYIGPKPKLCLENDPVSYFEIEDDGGKFSRGCEVPSTVRAN